MSSADIASFRGSVFRNIRTLHHSAGFYISRLHLSIACLPSRLCRASLIQERAVGAVASPMFFIPKERHVFRPALAGEFNRYERDHTVTFILR